MIPDNCALDSYVFLRGVVHVLYMELNDRICLATCNMIMTSNIVLRLSRLLKVLGSFCCVCFETLFPRARNISVDFLKAYNICFSCRVADVVKAVCHTTDPPTVLLPDNYVRLRLR